MRRAAYSRDWKNAQRQDVDGVSRWKIASLFRDSKACITVRCVTCNLSVRPPMGVPLDLFAFLLSSMHLSILVGMYVSIYLGRYVSYM